MADTKTTDLTENTAPVGADLVYMVDDPGGSAASQKVTFANFSKGLFSDSEGDPAAVSNTGSADGTSVYPARRDHAHLRSAFVGARYTSNATQNIVNGAAAAIVNFEDQVYDSGSLVTIGAAWKFTAPTTGYYHVDAMIHLAASAGWVAIERAYLHIYKGGVYLATIGYNNSTVSGGVGIDKFVGGGATIPLTAAEYIDLRAAQDSGGDLALSNDPGSVWVNIERVG